MNREEFLGKIEWEGGVIDAMDYGLRTCDIDEDDTELRDAWDHALVKFNELKKSIRPLEDLLDEVLI